MWRNFSMISWFLIITKKMQEQFSILIVPCGFSISNFNFITFLWSLISDTIDISNLFWLKLFNYNNVGRQYLDNFSLLHSHSVPPHVKSEVVRPGESLVAEVTLEGFVPRVLPEVPSQLVRPTELPAAVLPPADVISDCNKMSVLSLCHKEPAKGKKCP